MQNSERKLTKKQFEKNSGKDKESTDGNTERHFISSKSNLDHINVQKHEEVTTWPAFIFSSLSISSFL